LHAPGGQELLETQIVAETFFRLQIGIGEEVEGRKADEQLLKRRRLEPGVDAALDFRVRFRNEPGQRHAISRPPPNRSLSS
jgi:hypothetical protein